VWQGPAGLCLHGAAAPLEQLSATTWHRDGCLSPKYQFQVGMFKVNVAVVATVRAGHWECWHGAGFRGDLDGAMCPSFAATCEGYDVLHEFVA